MSQENVEVVRRLYEHWGRGDWNTGEFFDPAVKYARIGSDVPGDAGEWNQRRSPAADDEPSPPTAFTSTHGCAALPHRAESRRDETFQSHL